jgi:cytochrome P450
MSTERPEPSVVIALKKSFSQSQPYYAALREFGGSQSAFFDHYLKGHVIVGYSACQDIYRRPSDFGRGRLSMPANLFDGRPNAARGYHLLQAMSIFQDAGTAYSQRRQHLLSIVGHSKQTRINSLVSSIAAEHASRFVKDQAIDVFTTSLRPFAVQCANLATLEVAQVPNEVTTDALAVAFFFDGKRPQIQHVLNAMDAVNRLGDWLSAETGLSRISESEALADLLLLYVAAHESPAYLLHTCLIHLCGEGKKFRYRCEADFRSLVTEAIRYDAPIQMSGRVAMQDVSAQRTHLELRT